MSMRSASSFRVHSETPGERYERLTKKYGKSLHDALSRAEEIKKQDKENRQAKRKNRPKSLDKSDREKVEQLLLEEIAKEKSTLNQIIGESDELINIQKNKIENLVDQVDELRQFEEAVQGETIDFDDSFKKNGDKTFLLLVWLMVSVVILLIWNLKIK